MPQLIENQRSSHALYRSSPCPMELLGLPCISGAPELASLPRVCSVPRVLDCRLHFPMEESVGIEGSQLEGTRVPLCVCSPTPDIQPHLSHQLCLH